VADDAYPLSDYTLPAEDLEHILEGVDDLWEELRGCRVFITGGTGFFGQWLVESFAYANERRRLGASAVVLTRDPETALARVGRSAPPPAVTYVRGDVRRFELSSDGFEWCIHGATAASATLNAEAPDEMMSTIVDGTRHVLSLAERQVAAGKLRGLLLLSSGAVYGRQPPELTHVSEDYGGGPDIADPTQAYAEGKRLAELLGVISWRNQRVPVKVGRCFAFVGPYLPLDAHFAIGNFIGDVLRRDTIQLSGDGSPFRSYMYAADLATWLWTILIRGASGRAYNVGSERDAALWDIAQLVREVLRGEGAQAPVRARDPDPSVPAPRYVPSTRRARAELGLSERIPLEEGIRRTYRWYSGAHAESAL
jgi:nucleoside-diphosphate-sugar epimerase